MDDEEVGFETDDAGDVEVEETGGEDSSNPPEMGGVPNPYTTVVKRPDGTFESTSIDFSIPAPDVSGTPAPNPPSTSGNPTQEGKPITGEASEEEEDKGSEEEPAEDLDGTITSSPRVEREPIDKVSPPRIKKEKYKNIEELEENVKAERDRIKENAKSLKQNSKESQDKLQAAVNRSGTTHNEKVQKIVVAIPVPQQPQIPPCPPRPPLKPPFVTRPNAPLGDSVRSTYYFLKFAETNAPFEEPTFYDVANIIFTIADRYCANGNLVSGKQELDTVNTLAKSALNPDHIDKKTAKKLASKTVMEKIKQQYESHVEEASVKYGIPKEQIRAIIATESAGKSDATSGAAWGLMQMTKATWNGTQTKHPELANYGFDSYWKDPQVNIQFGTATLKDKMESIGVSASDPNFAGLAVTAYNAGEGTVKKAISLAKQAGSANPTADCLKAEYLKPAIASTGIYKFYFSGNGYKRNPHMKDKGLLKDGSTLEQATAAAIDLKYKEVSQYPSIVSAYLELQ